MDQGKTCIRLQKRGVLLLPAGIAHKKIKATKNFKIVGAYPNGLKPDIQKGNPSDYEKVRKVISDVSLPQKDPVEGSNGPLIQYWNKAIH